MNVKRFIGTSLLVFIVIEVINFFVHGVIFKKTYASLGALWRPDMMSKMWIIHVGYLILSFIFTYIFIKGYEKKGVMEGFRYGIIIGLFANIPYAFFEYAIFPLPFALCLGWFIFGMIEYIFCGMIAAATYKPRER
jgi:hypothetical protein